MTYAAVMLLAEERPGLLAQVLAAHEIAVRYGNQFSPSSVIGMASGITPDLRALSLRGIVVKFGETRRGRRALYRLDDPRGVERALRELGLI